MKLSRRAGPLGLAVHEHDADPPPDHGLAVVLVHGTMDRATSLAKVARRLPDLRVVRYDRRGYGDSRLGPDGAPVEIVDTIDAQIDDLLAVIDGVPSVVVGHSMGGTVALAAAARHPDLVRAVGAYESPRPWADWWPTASAGGRVAGEAEADPAEAAERFMRRMVGDDRWERLPARVRELRRGEGPALVADMTSTRRGPAYVDAQVRVPVVAAHGGASSSRHTRTAEELAASVPHGELLVIHGAGHGAHLTHPDEFAGLVRRVVERATGPR